LQFGSNRLLPASNRGATGGRDGGAMTVAVVTPPAPRPEALTAHTFGLPVVRELPQPVADAAGERSW
jgi:hypothetical protein